MSTGKTLRRRFPKLWLGPGVVYDNVPAAQHDALRLVGHALDNMAYFVDCFESALKLFDASGLGLKTEKRASKRELLRNWQFLAARDGAISIYHFGQSIEAFRQSLHECPYVASRFDMKALKQAWKTFKSRFPNYELVRHSVGHAAEKTRDLKRHSEHGFTGTIRHKKRPSKVKGYVMIDNLQGRRYSNSWSGKIESYRIGPATLKHLTTIRDIIFDEFQITNSKL